GGRSPPGSRRGGARGLGPAQALRTLSVAAPQGVALRLRVLRPANEGVMPRYTLVSTANAFVLRGAKIVFVDIRRDTMNIDETLIEAAITDKTRAIVPVHYAGVACEMDPTMAASYTHLRLKKTKTT
ncbi:hypothetical protein G6X41_04790, partial [Staphylococcus aureus]|nr:hypothetical protein [Staphylococcus aureus]